MSKFKMVVEDFDEDNLDKESKELLAAAILAQLDRAVIKNGRVWMLSRRIGFAFAYGEYIGGNAVLQYDCASKTWKSINYIEIKRNSLGFSRLKKFFFFN